METLTEPHERLRHARQSAGYKSASKAAEAIGVKTSTYIAHENGQNKFDLDVAKRYARKFRADAFWIMAGSEDGRDEIPASISSETGPTGIPDNTIPEIDVRGGLGGGGLTVHLSASRGGMTFASESIRDYWRLPDWMLAKWHTKAAQVAAFPVQGDSMSPTLADGDVVFIDTNHKLPSPPGIYALADEFGGVVVKRLEVISRRGEAPLVSVISDNPRHSTRDLPLSELSIIGRYLGRFTL